MNSKPKFIWDEYLRDNPEDPGEIRAQVLKLEIEFEQTAELDRRAGLLGEIGTYLRTLGELHSAERKLRESLAIILGIGREIQQKIRLAHVLQWKKAFAESNILFEEVIVTCRGSQAAASFLDFALQHAGKNYFDQKLFEQALGYFEEALDLRERQGATSALIASTRKAIQRTEYLIGVYRVKST